LRRPNGLQHLDALQARLDALFQASAVVQNFFDNVWSGFLALCTNREYEIRVPLPDLLLRFIEPGGDQSAWNALF
jgi:hypothetical protein